MAPKNHKPTAISPCPKFNVYRQLLVILCSNCLFYDPQALEIVDGGSFEELDYEVEWDGRWDGSASVRDSGMVMAIGRKYLKYLGSRDDIRISHFIDVYDDKKLVS